MYFSVDSTRHYENGKVTGEEKDGKKERKKKRERDPSVTLERLSVAEYLGPIFLSLIPVYLSLSHRPLRSCSSFFFCSFRLFFFLPPWIFFLLLFFISFPVPSFRSCFFLLFFSRLKDSLAQGDATLLRCTRALSGAKVCSSTNQSTKLRLCYRYQTKRPQCSRYHNVLTERRTFRLFFLHLFLSLSLSLTHTHVHYLYLRSFSLQYYAERATSAGLDRWPTKGRRMISADPGLSFSSLACPLVEGTALLRNPGSILPNYIYAEYIAFLYTWHARGACTMHLTKTLKLDWTIAPMKKKESQHPTRFSFSLPLNLFFFLLCLESDGVARTINSSSNRHNFFLLLHSFQSHGINEPEKWWKLWWKCFEPIITDISNSNLVKLY